ncbi:PIN domain-containing protein [Georgenia yuyongxinii]|uniref:NYN domain-containing protein n=1 Tax=Georgenia yuyongxinii TaxID=2589797 RepID=A0A552WLT7_9MICO|nr:PIN domain-containing protein [Georgenia yuyongxinii]TRW43731.1 NYN domain-containing protein [Georgenia yuyongxinii]
MDTEERLAVFLDYENLALGAREHLGGMTFDFGPIADALAVRGRVLVRRAYADWSYFDEDRRSLTRHQVELIEMPQKMGASRKNAADIKMVVDAIEMAFERDYISTFVMCTGDSDFSPLVHKLRELDKRVIGVGVENSTSRLLPPACDEFLFYDRLEGVEVPEDTEPRERRSRSSRGTTTPRREPATRSTTAEQPGGPPSAEPASPAEPEAVETEDQPEAEPQPLEVLLAQTLAGLASAPGAVTASLLKRSLLRKDPTFSESDYGFRSFGEILKHLAERGIVELSKGPAAGDPEVSLPELGERDSAFELLREVVASADGFVLLSGLKNSLRKRRPDFSEKALGYRNFLQFCKAAQADEVVHLRWDDAAEDYIVSV